MKSDYLYLCLIVLLDVMAVLVGALAGNLIARVPNFQDVENPENTNTPRVQFRKLQGVICIGFGACSIPSIGNHAIPTIMILVFGVLLSELFDISGYINHWIIKIVNVFVKNNGVENEETFPAQVIESTMISVAGALSVFASIELAVNHDPSKMILKIILDVIGCMILSSSGNPLAIAVSALPIGIYQFAWFFGATLAAPFATPAVSEMVGGMGGVVLVVIGLYLLGIDSNLKSADYIVPMILPFVASALHLI